MRSYIRPPIIFVEEPKNIGHSCLEVLGSHLTEDFLTSMKRENAESCPRKRKKAAFRASPVGRLFSLLKVRNCAKAKRLAQKKNTSQVLWTLTGVFDIWWRTLRRRRTPSLLPNFQTNDRCFVVDFLLFFVQNCSREYALTQVVTLRSASSITAILVLW